MKISINKLFVAPAGYTAVAPGYYPAATYLCPALDAQTYVHKLAQALKMCNAPRLGQNRHAQRSTHASKATGPLALSAPTDCCCLPTAANMLHNDDACEGHRRHTDSDLIVR
jgi:hypothetical protein